MKDSKLRKTFMQSPEVLSNLFVVEKSGENGICLSLGRMGSFLDENDSPVSTLSVGFRTIFERELALDLAEKLLEIAGVENESDEPE